MFLIIGLFLTFALGYLFIVLLDAKLGNYERLSLAAVIGLGLMTQLLFGLELLHIQYSTISILSSLLGIDLFLLLISFRKVIRLEGNFNEKLLRKWGRSLKEFPRIEKVFFFGLLLLIMSAFIRALYWPVWYWDSLALYDYRARIFTAVGGIAKSAVLSSLPMHSYPPMTSLAHTFIYILGGGGANPQLIYPFFYLALIATFYASLRKYCQRWASLLVTLSLASTPLFVEFSANAYTNLPYAFYFGMGTVYLYRFIKEGGWALLVLAGVLLGLSGWTRSPTEQFFAVDLLILTAVCFWKRKYFLAPIILTFLFVVLALPWRVYVADVLRLAPVSAEVTNAMSSGLSQPLDLGKLLTVIVLLLGSIKTVSGTSLTLVILVSVFFPKSVRKNFLLFLIIFLNFAILAAGSYSFSISWEDWKDSIANSADRLSMIFPPIALYYSAINIPPFLNKLKGGR